MRPPLVYTVLMVLLGVGLTACDAGKSSNQDTEPTPDTQDSADPFADVLQQCGSGTSWTPGTTAFSDASEAWRLVELAPVGVRLSVGDINGDGWPDLVVRNGTSGEDFSDGGTRNTWLLLNERNGTFTDITESSGFVTPRVGSSPRSAPVVVWGDVDNDGDLDAYAGIPDTRNTIDETSEILLNDGAGNFTLGPEVSDLRQTRNDAPYGAAFVDFDRDGFLDLWVTRYTSGSSAAQDVLYRGDGTGAFTEVTDTVGLTTRGWFDVGEINNALAHTYAWSAAACDLNQDGWPELLSASYGRAPNHLWLNTGGAFDNHSVASGYAYDHRTDWTDNESARCHCTLHPEDDDCDGVGEPELIRCSSDADVFRWSHSSDREPYRLGGNSGATVCRDVDNDGAVDLLTTEIVHWDVGESSDPSELLFNTGGSEPAFERPGNDATGLTREHAGVTWDDGDITGSLFDFDNDGWTDVYIGSSDYPDTRGLLYHQDAPRSFSAVLPEDGIDHPRSHGSAIADFDRDGDLDIVVGHSTARCADDCRDTFEIRLFENQLSADTNWVQLDLQPGSGANGSAIGATVTVATASTTQLQQVQGGFGQWGNQDDRILHVGLGEDCVAEVTVQWPDAAGSTDTYYVGSGYRWVLAPGQDAQPITD